MTTHEYFHISNAVWLLIRHKRDMNFIAVKLYNLAPFWIRFNQNILQKRWILTYFSNISGMLLDQLKGRHNDDLIAMNLIQAFFYVWWFDIEDVYSFRTAQFPKTYGLHFIWFQFVRYTYLCDTVLKNITKVLLAMLMFDKDILQINM